MVTDGYSYLFFQMRTHHGIYDEILEGDEHKDADGLKDRFKPKLTLSESVLALVVSIACVSMIAVFLVTEIDFIVENHGVKDA
jgi:Ca2+:H+ antiporter